MPCIIEAGAELVELTLKRRGRIYISEVLVDKESGGITLGECSIINRQIFHKLEESPILGEDFELEVASPGLDRPLKTSKDFARVCGRPIRVHLRTPVAQRLEYSGILKNVQENQITVDAPQGQIELSIENIQKAVQEI